MMPSCSVLFVSYFALAALQPLAGQQPAGQKDIQGDSLPPGAILRMGSVRMRHAHWIWSVDFAPDNKRVASADYNGTIRVWELKTGRLLYELPGKAGSVVRFSPDGKLLAACGYYMQCIAIYDAQSGEKLRELPQNARALAFSSDGKLLAAAGKEGIARLWDASTGELSREFKGHLGALFSIAISSDGKLLATGGGGDGTAPTHTEIRLWNTDTGAESRRLEGHNGWVYSLAFSGDGKTLASASPYDGRIWSVEDGKQRFLLDQAAYAVAFSPTEGFLATSGAHGVHDPSTGRSLFKLEGDLSGAQCIAYSPDGRLLATGDQKGRLQLWDAATGKELVRNRGHSHAVSAVAFSLDGSIAASASSGDGTLRLWGLASGAQLRSYEVEWGAESSWYPHGQEIFFPPDGKLVGVAGGDGQARFFELAGVRRRVLRVGPSNSRMTMNRDGTLLAAALPGKSSGMEVGLYDLDDGKEIRKINPFAKREGPDSWLTRLAFSPDGKLLAVCLSSRGGPSEETKDLPPTVQLWEVATGKLVRSFRQDENAPGYVTFSPDGKLLAVAATGRTPLHLWNVATGEEVQKFAVKDAGRSWYEWSPCAFSPDGKILAGATLDLNIVLWELATGKEIRRFSGHTKRITALAFSPDGRTLLSGSEDATVLLWDLASAAARVPRAAAADEKHSWDAAWEDLAEADPAIAYRSVRQFLKASDRAIAMLRQRLDLGPELDPGRLPQLIAELGAGDESSQRAAANRIKQYGVQASPALYEALRKEGDVAVRTRVELVLETIGEFPIPADDLRRLRALQILEGVASPEAEQILHALVTGAPSEQQAAAVRAVLRRLEERRRRLPVKVKLDD